MSADRDRFVEVWIDLAMLYSDKAGPMPAYNSIRDVLERIAEYFPGVDVYRALFGALTVIDEAANTIATKDATIRAKDRELAELRGRLETIGRKAFWSARS